MSQIEFFYGEKVHGPKTLHNGASNGKLTCIVTEEWIRKNGWSIACGEKRRFSLKKTIGVSTIERQQFEALFSGSLNIKSLLGVKHEIKRHFGFETRIDEIVEETDEFTFEAPKCGRLNQGVYQLRRTIHFTFKDERPLFERLPLWWKDKSFKDDLIEWVNEIYDLPLIEDPDLRCKCTDQNPKTDGVVNLFFDNFGMAVRFRQKEKVIEFPDINLSVSAKGVENIFHREVSLKRVSIPPHLIFLTNERKERIVGVFKPFVEQPSQGDPIEVAPNDQLLYFLLGGSLGIILGIILAKNLDRKTVSKIQTFYQSTREVHQIGPSIGSIRELSKS
jgi:hypothetical protein